MRQKYQMLAIVWGTAYTYKYKTLASGLASLQLTCVNLFRGGYCFELNGLLAAALRTMGFNLYTAFARVILEPPAGNSDEVGF